MLDLYISETCPYCQKVMEFFEYISFEIIKEGWPIYLLVILILYGLQLLIYFETKNGAKKEVELQLLEHEFNIKSTD